MPTRITRPSAVPGTLAARTNLSSRPRQLTQRRMTMTRMRCLVWMRNPRLNPTLRVTPASRIWTMQCPSLSTKKKRAMMMTKIDLLVETAVLLGNQERLSLDLMDFYSTVGYLTV